MSHIPITELRLERAQELARDMAVVNSRLSLATGTGGGR